MTTITISLPDERLRALQQATAQLKVTSEDLVSVSVQELLARPVEEFQTTVDYVLVKNAELYRRMA